MTIMGFNLMQPHGLLLIFRSRASAASLFQSYAVTQTASLRRENVRKGLPISIFRSHADCFYAIRTNVQALYCFQSYAAVWAASRGEADTPRSHFNLMQSYRLLRQ